MKIPICERCGSHEFNKNDNLMVCKYCLTEYAIQTSDMPLRNTNINLDQDIISLLEKCRDDPANARRYANLVLDIDPSNVDAKKYI